MRQLPDDRPRPFAVGVLALGANPSGPDRTAARLDLALDTYKLGYFLIDTIEIDDHGTGYLAAELLVSHATPEALVARGPVDADWLHAIADRHPLAIHSSEEIPRTALDAIRARMLRWKGGRV